MRSEAMRFGANVESLVLVAGRSPVVVVLCSGLALAAYKAAHEVGQLPWSSHWASFTAISAIVLALFAGVYRVATRSSPLPIIPFIVTTMMAGVALRITYSCMVQPEWYTDFLRYWEYGVRLASHDSPQITNVYGARAHFLTRPLIEIFGDDRRAVPISNVILLSCIQLLGYDILRRARNHQAAQAFSLLWLASPEPLMTSVVPNHDLAGLFLLAAALWTWQLARIERDRRKLWHAVCAGIAIGVILSLLEAVRGLGTLSLLTLSLLIAAIAAIKFARGTYSRELRDLGFVFVVITAAFVSTNAILAASGSLMPDEAKRASMLRFTTPHSSSLSDGTYNFGSGFAGAFTNQIDDIEDFSEFRKSLVISDFIHDPVRRVAVAIERMERQYYLASQRGFYLRGISDPIKRHISVFTNVYIALFACSLILAAYSIALYRMRDVGIDHFLLVLISITSLSLLLIGENQPRYLSAIWLGGAMVIASQLSLRPRRPRLASPLLIYANSAILLVLLIALAWITASLTFGEQNGRIISNWSYSSDAEDEPEAILFLEDLQQRETLAISDRRGRPIPTHFGSLSLKLMLPQTANANVVLAERQLCHLKEGALLNFYYDSPAGHSVEQGAFGLQVTVDGAPIWMALLPHEEGPLLARVALPGTDRCVSVGFRLQAHAESYPDVPREASSVEIFFPRLAG